MRAGLDLRPEPDLGDFMVTLLAGNLAGLRDRLALDGFYCAAELVADLVEITDDYLTRAPGIEREEETGWL